MSGTTLSRTIEDDLRAHIRGGEAPPYPLTLNGIAEHFGVSLMPARAAVATLVDEQFLIRQENGRLSINPRRRQRKAVERDETPPDSVPPEKVLADYIIQLSLTGETTYLREEATAEQFGIGRTVLRRIFNRFAGENLIEHVPRCGWCVHAYRQQDMIDFLEVRETLELRAIDLAKPKLQEDQLQKFLEANTPYADGTPRLENSLHRYWMDLADNRYMTDFFAQHGVYFQVLFDRAVMDEATVAQRATEHREILTALINKNWSRAKRDLSQHIQGQRANVARMFETMKESASAS